MKEYTQDTCSHCWHHYRGAILMVIPDGHVVQECCKCHQHRTVHAEHTGRKRWQRKLQA